MDPRSGLEDEIVDGIDRLHAAIAARQHQLLRLVAHYDSTNAWQYDGCRDMAQWLSGRLGISTWTARRWVEAAHALADLPELSDALESGVLCLDKVVELTRVATPETEAKLITWARRVSPAAIRRTADLAHRRCLEEARDIDDARFLRWWYFDDGNRLGLEGQFPAVHGAAIAAALRRVADKLPETPPEELPGVTVSPEDVLEQRLADALLVLASQTRRDDWDADRATVVVHTTLGAVRDDGASAIEGGPVIHPETARRLSCDARLQFVLTDNDGNSLGIGRKARGVPRWLMRELRHRDHGCTFPGCGTRAFLQAHHIHHWEHGGPTDLDNLVLTCHFHHKLVHELGWDVSLSKSMVKWFRPSGKRYDPGPDPPALLPTVTKLPIATVPVIDRLAAAV